MVRHRGAFLQQSCPYKSAILDLSILFKTNYLVSFLAKKFDKFLSISIKTGFAFPTKSIGASSVALTNPPFCGNTFFTETRLEPAFCTTNSMAQVVQFIFLSIQHPIQLSIHPGLSESVTSPIHEPPSP